MIYRREIAEAARAYMAERMGMTEVTSDQHENQIWSHMVEFAVRILEAQSEGRRP